MRVCIKHVLEVTSKFTVPALYLYFRLNSYCRCLSLVITLILVHTSDQVNTAPVHMLWNPTLGPYLKVPVAWISCRKRHIGTGYWKNPRKTECGQAAVVLGSSSPESQEHKETGLEQDSLPLEASADHFGHGSACHCLYINASLMFLYWEGLECSPGWEGERCWHCFTKYMF